MIARFEAVDPTASADELTKEYVEATVAEALDDLRTPGAGEFFGRIIEAAGDTWYIGRRHIENDRHDPEVVDWRAPVAAPFYRATHVDPFGLAHRRRFTLADGDITAYFDEQLDDPDHQAGGSGIPDPVLAEIGAARTGAMRDIVGTIQAEQDVVIRAPLAQCLIVQGGPGTGKTAVGLHRAAYLLFEHRRRLVRDGVLVVGPNRVFLDYIGNVLPSLGERSVRQCTAADLCVPKVPISGTDSPSERARKGDPAMLDMLAAASVAHIGGRRLPAADLRIPVGARILTVTRDEIAGWLHQSADARTPVNHRRAALRAVVERDLLRRYERDDLWQQMPALRAALTKAWPTRDPVQLVHHEVLGGRGTARQWTIDDQFLVDEANSLLNGTPFTYGHVVVDEAQDHSAVALRCIGRRSPTSSMTVLGDLAQSTTPAGQRGWADAARWLGADGWHVAPLTIGYRVPGAILEVANRLLPFTAVHADPSTSVRTEGATPVLRMVANTVAGHDPAALSAAVADEVVAVRHRHRNTGVVAPDHSHPAITDALVKRGLHATDQVHGLGPTDVPLFTPEAVKGLEFDGVVVVSPHEIFDGSPRGARLLYVSLTRAVQTLHIVTDAELPHPL